MFSDKIIYGLGILVCAYAIMLWIIVLKSMFSQFEWRNATNIKVIIIVFGCFSLYSNIMPVWFDIYQISRDAHPSNIVFAYSISQYLYRFVTATMFYLIYRTQNLS